MMTLAPTLTLTSALQLTPRRAVQKSACTPAGARHPMKGPTR